MVASPSHLQGKGEGASATPAARESPGAAAAQRMDKEPAGQTAEPVMMTTPPEMGTQAEMGAVTRAGRYSPRIKQLCPS